MKSSTKSTGNTRWHLSPVALLMAALLIGWSAPSHATEADTLWIEHFDDPSWEDNWHASNGTWQAGIPTSGPGSVISDPGCAATNLAGNYPASASTRLVRHLPFTVPPADECPRLRFWHWFSFNVADYGRVQIRVDGGSWQSIGSQYTSTSGRYTRGMCDLSGFAGESVEIAFYLYAADDYWTSGSDVSSGWYVDDVALVTGETDLYNPEDWESGLGDWWATHGVWQVGSPNGGPGTAYSGSKCAGTCLSGDYPANQTSSLVSPWFVVPDTSENPRIRFWHWFSFSVADYGYLRIQVKGGSWVTHGATYSSYCGRWTRPAYDLSQYANDTIRVAFYFHSEDDYWTSGSDVTSGWYVDDIEIVTGPIVLNNPEDWETGLGDWWAYRGVWQVGTPTGGPGSAYSGTECAGTCLSGNYPSNQTSEFLSPWIVVPENSENPRLRFWHWFSFSVADYGYVRILPKGGSWETKGATLSQSSGGWTRPSYDLSPYGGDTIRIAFYFHSEDDYWTSGSDVSTGWYIDDVEIVTGPIVINCPEDWENGLGDWWVSRGIWQVGEPTAWPDSAYSGDNCAGTRLNGYYPASQSSYLVSPSFVVPPASEGPALRFRHKCSFSVADYGDVRISVNGGSWQTILGPYTSSSNSGSWTFPYASLSEYADSTVRVAFFFYSEDDYWTSGSDNSYGWYIDDVMIAPCDEPPVIDCPDSAYHVWVCQSGLVCVPVSISGADTVYSSFGIWNADELCFQADTAGAYTITLIAEGAAGSDSCLVEVIVDMIDPPSACFQADNAGGDSSLTVTFDNCSTVDGDASYFWEFGDGGTSTEYEPTHTYGNAGTYTVTLVASNECGQAATLSEYVTVTDTTTAGDSLLFPSEFIQAGESAWQPITLKLSQPAKGVSIPVTTEELVTITSFSTDGLITDGWQLDTLPNADSTVWSTRLYNFSNETIPAGEHQVLWAYFTVGAECDETTVLHFDTAYADDPLKRLAYTPDTGYVTLPLEFEFERDSTAVSGYVKGDITGDGIFDISDLVCIVSYYMGNDSCIDNLEAGDVNGDCVVGDITDIVMMADRIVGLDPPEFLCYCGNPPLAGKIATDLAEVSIAQLEGESVVEISAKRSLPALQLTLRPSSSDVDGIPTTSLQGMDVLHRYEDGLLTVAITDLDGLEVIGEGTTQLLSVAGDYELVSAQTVDPDYRTVELQIVAGKQVGVPGEFALGQNYPNPFNPVTEISFSLPGASQVKLEVYNSLGQRVQTLVDRRMEAGHHSVTFDGSTMASGIYFYRLQASDLTATRKMLLLK